VLAVLGATLVAYGELPAQGTKREAEDTSSGLPLPSALPLSDYEARLYQFLFRRKYRELGWAVDRGVRDTGPFVLGTYYGTHPAARVWYSPSVIEWLKKRAEQPGGEFAGKAPAIPDGAMIIKEMFAPPAARYAQVAAEIASKYPNDPEKAKQLLEAALASKLSAWAVMVKDKSISKDGWFWANPAPGSEPDQFGYPFLYPASGTGNACLRCHASAKDESTFSSLSNITGFEKHGEPLRFRVDNSWRKDVSKLQKPAAGATEGELLANTYGHLPEAQRPQTRLTVPSMSEPHADVLSTFNPLRVGPNGKLISILPPAESHLSAFPGQWMDHVPAPGNRASHFLSSDNCLGCHGGLAGTPYSVTMFVKTGPKYGDGYNVSPYGEWRWSPMGLAGRDPIFFAQLESELALLEDDVAPKDLPVARQALTNTCLSCHGAMGQRQLAIDHAHKRPGIRDPNFYYPDYVTLTDPLTQAAVRAQKATKVNGLRGRHSVYPYHTYGNLAREGISCAVCHHIAPPRQWEPGMSSNEKLELFLMHSTTGAFPYGKADQLGGPFADVKLRPMENALGITPVHEPYLRDSKMCGTCHTINLPNVDWPKDKPLPGLTLEHQEALNQAARNAAERSDAVPLSGVLAGFQHSIEQATYLEWENSSYAYPKDKARSCHSCHMPGGFRTLDGKIDIQELSTQIATIQDSSYPEAEHDLENTELDIPVRHDYKRHAFVGLNVVLLELFSQFDRILGVDRSDVMTSATNGNELAIETMLLQARDATVAVDVEIASAKPGKLVADVHVTNKVGHRFPSGVGFRRAFLEVVVVDTTGGVERIVWGSGRTNSVGVIVDGQGEPLATEFLDQKDAQGSPRYQPHHERVTREDQVQIYEELVKDAKGEFTTSFVHRITHPKDNRLLPFGFLDPKKDAAAFERRFGRSNKIRAFMAATAPHGRAAYDNDFGAGRDTVRYEMTLPQQLEIRALRVKATMYYQSIPPYWLQHRFSQAPDGKATQRLYYLTSHLDTKGTPVESWKLELESNTASVEKFLAGGR